MLDHDQSLVLAGLIDTTFGRSSIRDAGHAIAYKRYSDGADGLILEIRFETIVNVNSREGVATAQKEYDSQSQKAIGEALKQLKADFKTEAGSTLKIKEMPNKEQKDSFLEIISFNPSLLRGKYYRTINYLITN